MQTKIVTCGLMAILFIASGCNELGNGFQAIGEGDLGASSSGNGRVEESFQMASLDKDIEYVEDSLVDVDGELSKLDLSFLLAVGSGNAEESVKERLNSIFDKLYDAVEKLHAKSRDLRSQVDARLAKLDPSNPLHFALRMKLQEHLAYLDELEAKANEAVLKMADRVDRLLVQLNEKVSGMDSSKPQTWVVLFIWEQLKGNLIELHDKLVVLANS